MCAAARKQSASKETPPPHLTESFNADPAPLHQSCMKVGRRAHLVQFLSCYHDFEPVSNVQLLYQGGHVVLDRLFPDVDRVGDLSVRLSTHEQADNLPFPNAQHH